MTGIQRRSRYWLKLLALGIVAAGLLWFIFGRSSVDAPAPSSTILSGTPLPPGSDHSAQADANESAMAWMAASMQNDAFEGLDPEEVAKYQLTQTGHPSFVKAQRMLDCKDFMESSAAIGAEINSYSAAELERPETKHQIFMDKVLKIRCRDVKPVDYEEVDKLMNAAALQGDVAARSYKAMVALAKEEETAHRQPAPDGSRPASAGAKAAAKELLEFAMLGDSRAIASAYEITATDRYGLQDSLASAAWALVAAQNPLTRTFDAAEPRGQPPRNMPRTDREKVIARASAIYELCCAARP